MHIQSVIFRSNVSLTWALQWLYFCKPTQKFTEFFHC